MRETEKNDLDRLLHAEHFDLIITNEFPELFGNLFEVWRSPSLNIRFVQDRGTQSLDISGLLDENCWFELELIRALFEDGSLVSIPLTIPNAVAFLSAYLPKLGELFDAKHYLHTKRQLEELRDTRMKKMFPNL
jgi:hypothetical protein